MVQEAVLSKNKEVEKCNAYVYVSGIILFSATGFGAKWKMPRSGWRKTKWRALILQNRARGVWKKSSMEKHTARGEYAIRNMPEVLADVAIDAPPYFPTPPLPEAKKTAIRVPLQGLP